MKNISLYLITLGFSVPTELKQKYAKTEGPRFRKLKINRSQWSSKEISKINPPYGDKGLVCENKQTPYISYIRI